MTKAVVLARVFPPQVGGSGRFLCELYRRQPANEYFIVAGEHERAADFDRASTTHIQRMPLQFADWGLVPRGFGKYATTYLQLAKLLRRQRAGAVHAATLLPEGFLACLLSQTCRVPYLSFVHGEELPIAASSGQLSWMARRVLQGARKIIANSENTHRTLLRDWPVDPAKVTVITPGVDVESHRPAPCDEAMRAKLGWTGRRVVLSAGRLQERKGHDHLLRALPAIRNAIPDVLYSIAGDGDRRAALQSLSASLQLSDRVQFLGELSGDQLIACYQQCDLLALPNREVNGDFEGFGMVLIEAQACGRPVLAGKSGGTAETLRDGETGCLADCSTPEPLAAALIKMLRSPSKLESMGQAARKWVESQFDWRILAAKAQQVFDEMTGKPGAFLK